MSGNMKFALLGSTALRGRIGRMTPAERSKGRYMRAPDGHGDDGGFAEFVAAGEVETGKPADGIETNIPEPEPKTPKKAAGGGSGKPPREAAKPAAEKPAAAAAAEKAKGAGKPGAAEPEAEEGEEGAEGDEDEDEDEDEEKPEKPKRKMSERFKELTGKNRSQGRLIEQLSSRLAALEKGGLPANQNGGNSNAIGEAPDPNDTAKYPLGHLDDRYIEDKLEWLAETKAAARADAALQRQQGDEQGRQAEQAHAALLEKVDDLSTRGSELYDDFQDAVVDAGMRGDWRLEQPTFEAAHEAENGARILYELSQDKAEAKRVAALSPYGQMKFVMDRDAEISAGAKPRRIPGAGAPPATQTKGANSRTRIDPATSNLDDFEKAWAADAKG